MYEENLALEAENTETQTVEEIAGETGAEETVKTYTQEEYDAGIQRRLARQEAKLRKEFEEKYSPYREMGEVMNAGLGTSDIVEATSRMRDFYESKGVQIPQRQTPSYSEEDTRVLANHEAQKIIDYGIEAVIEEVDSLANKGYENMTPKEKLMFNQLATYRQAEMDKTELAKIGVSEEALQDANYIEFAKDLNPNLSTKEKYERYLKYKPKPQFETIGSMKQIGVEDSGVKDFYSYEEAVKFTAEDFKKNPALLKAVENSMPKWTK